MKLSELLVADPCPERAFGVEVDVEAFDPPPGLREVSFMTPVGADGMIDERVLDTAIAYLIAQVEVILEIPAEEAISDPAYLMSVAASVGVHVALLPPTSDDAEAFEAYVRRVEAFVPLYASQPNFAKFMLPVTSYLEYLFIEAIDPDRANAFTPSDEFVVQRYHSVTSQDRADALKARMRKAFEDHYGGAEPFLDFRKALMAGVYKDFERNIKVGSQPADGVPPVPA